MYQIEDRPLDSTDNSVIQSNEKKVGKKKPDVLFKGVLLDIPEDSTVNHIDEHPTSNMSLLMNTSMCTEMSEEIVIPYISR